ncbi:hypothetical protein [Bradyrhizobium sp. 18]|uniref:hypothetical protein n=1 Tax=Bradyrhizobium sp. 18 TaxID=2782657 RepID=UPI001FF854B5|nr:hypothetical protein [Bradyrhizobium sp. 18]MCK1504565.1 hypothetical protein [Bradyrhizobium sp. 18]
MKYAELKLLEQRIPTMTLDELDALAKELQALRVIVTSEQRKHRGQRGAGVLGVNGQIFRK